MIIIYALAFLGLCAAIYRAWSRKIDDAEAMYWATVREPLIFLSEHAFDGEVEARAAYAKKMLVESGNKFLVSPSGEVAVWCRVYRVHMGVLLNTETVLKDHSRWYDLTAQAMANQKAQWIATRAEWIGDKAGQVFGGQRVNINSN